MKKIFIGILISFMMFTGCANVDVGLGLGVYHHVGPHRHGATYTHWIGPDRRDEFTYSWEFQLGHQGHHHENRPPQAAGAPTDEKPDTDKKRPTRKKKKPWWWKLRKYHHHYHKKK